MGQYSHLIDMETEIVSESALLKAAELIRQWLGWNMNSCLLTPPVFFHDTNIVSNTIAQYSHTTV